MSEQDSAQETEGGPGGELRTKASWETSTERVARKRVVGSFTSTY